MRKIIVLLINVYYLPALPRPPAYPPIYPPAPPLLAWPPVWRLPGIYFFHFTDVVRIHQTYIDNWLFYKTKNIGIHITIASLSGAMPCYLINIRIETNDTTNIHCWWGCSSRASHYEQMPFCKQTGTSPNSCCLSTIPQRNPHVGSLLFMENDLLTVRRADVRQTVDKVEFLWFTLCTPRVLAAHDRGYLAEERRDWCDCLTAQKAIGNEVSASNM